MTDLTIPPARLDAWRARYADWAEHRERVSTEAAVWANGGGSPPSPNDWEYSDDTAVELLHEIAALLSAP